jgi:hypothetical protein
VQTPPLAAITTAADSIVVVSLLLCRKPAFGQCMEEPHQQSRVVPGLLVLELRQLSWPDLTSAKEACNGCE